MYHKQIVAFERLKSKFIEIGWTRWMALISSGLFEWIEIQLLRHIDINKNHSNTHVLTLSQKQHTNKEISWAWVIIIALIGLKQIYCGYVHRKLSLIHSHRVPRDADTVITIFWTKTHMMLNKFIQPVCLSMISDNGNCLDGVVNQLNKWHQQFHLK